MDRFEEFKKIPIAQQKQYLEMIEAALRMVQNYFKLYYPAQQSLEYTNLQDAIQCLLDYGYWSRDVQENQCENT